MLAEEKWAEIDADIFAGRRLFAIQKIRAHVDSLGDASELLHDRYTVLRKRHPDKFTSGDEEYWSGYSECPFEAIAKDL